MSYIKVRVDEQKLYITDSPTIAAQGVNENSVLFSFSSDWTGYGKVAHFYRDEDPETVYQSVVDASGAAPIPYEITSAAGKICLGVAGVKDDVVKTSEVLKYRIVNGLYVAETSTPEPGIYEQMLATVGQINQLQIDFENDMTERQDEYESNLDSRLDSFESSIENKQATFESEIETAQTAFITDARLQLGRVVLFDGPASDGIHVPTPIMDLRMFNFSYDYKLGDFDRIVVYCTGMYRDNAEISILIGGQYVAIHASVMGDSVAMVTIEGCRNFNNENSTETFAKIKTDNYSMNTSSEWEYSSYESIIRQDNDRLYTTGSISFRNLNSDAHIQIVGYASGSNINSNGWYLDENNILHLS